MVLNLMHKFNAEKKLTDKEKKAAIDNLKWDFPCFFPKSKSLKRIAMLFAVNSI